MTVSRQQRRQRMRELTRAGESAVKKGLPRVASPAELLSLTLVLHDTLGDDHRRSPSVDCAQLAHRTYEASVRANPPRTPVACGKGCSYCCHAVVMVTAPEAFRLAREVESAEPGRATPGRADFLARAASTANLTAAERLGRKLPCPLLGPGGACSVYAARPLACRRVTSFAVKPCIEEYEGQEGDILVPQKLMTHATNAQLPLLAALRAFGRPARLYELSAAVRTILETDDAETRWRAGEDVFGPVASQDETARELVVAMERLSSEVLRLHRGSHD